MAKQHMNLPKIQSNLEQVKKRPVKEVATGNENERTQGNSLTAIANGSLFLRGFGRWL